MKIIKQHELLPFLAPHLPDNPVIVEAGAFIGKDTQRLASFWPKGTVHSFEPVPEIFEQLCKNTQHLANVHRYPVALSTHNGTATFNVSDHPKKPDTIYPAGSLLTPKERLTWSPARYIKTIQVPTVTLTSWMHEQSINHIDFLWLDMQGHELAVMQAAQETLKTVRIIFTEVEFIEAYAGQPLYTDVQAWLEQQGFTPVAKDFESTTSWFFGNMIFLNTR